MRAFKPRTKTGGYRNSLSANVTVENVTVTVTLWYGVLLEKLVVAYAIKEFRRFVEEIYPPVHITLQLGSTLNRLIQRPLTVFVYVNKNLCHSSANPAYDTNASSISYFPKT
jgi:hypothetical protein